jgi:hypothetical protein
MKCYVLIAVMAILPSLALAMGTETGNGGDGLVCYNPNGSIKSVRLLDFYESIKLKRIKKLDLGPDHLDYKQKVHYVLDRVEKINPTRANLYRKWFSTFFSEEEFRWGDKLVNIADTGVLDYPENCEVEQIAAQQEPEFEGDKRYTIRKKTWKKMDPRHRAGLILHELVYREAKAEKVCYDAGESTRCENFHQNSKRVRYFNSFLASAGMNSISQKEYHKLLFKVRLKTADANGFPFNLFYLEEKYQVGPSLIPYKIEYFPTGSVKVILEYSKSRYLPITEQKIFNYQNMRVSYLGGDGPDKYDSGVYFHEAGGIMSPLSVHPSGHDRDENGRSKVEVKITDSISMSFVTSYARTFSIVGYSDLVLTYNSHGSVSSVNTHFLGNMYIKVKELSDPINIDVGGDHRFEIADTGNMIGGDFSRGWNTISLTYNGKFYKQMFHGARFDEQGEGRLVEICYKEYCSTLENVIGYVEEASSHMGKTFIKKKGVNMWTREHKMKEKYKAELINQCEAYLSKNVSEEYQDYMTCKRVSSEDDRYRSTGGLICGVYDFSGKDAFECRVQVVMKGSDY